MKAPELPRAWYVAIFIAGSLLMALSAYALLVGLINGQISVQARGFLFVGPAAITMLVCGLLFGGILALSGWKKWSYERPGT